MGWTKLGTLAFLIFMMIFLSIFGSYFGFTVNGEPKGGEISLASAWDYFAGMMTFSIDDVPELFSYVFIFMTIMSAAIIVMMFLPGGGG